MHEKSGLDQEFVRSLQAHRSLNNTTSLISFYIPSTSKIPDLNKFVTSETSQCSNIKSRITRQGVKDALQGIQSQLKLCKTIPDNGLVLFSGNTDEGSVTKTFQPDRPVNNFLYRCDNKFWV
jgi:peptide chain release factor subunit 1